MAVAAAVDKRGLKRICMSCSTRFYDFSKRPIVCPNCSAEFTGDIKIRTRRARPAADEVDTPIIKDDEVEIEVIKDDEVEATEEAETISLDEAEEAEEPVEEAEDEVDADLELDEDLDDDEDDDDDDEDDDDEEEE